MEGWENTFEFFLKHLFAPYDENTTIFLNALKRAVPHSQTKWVSQSDGGLFYNTRGSVNGLVASLEALGCRPNRTPKELYEHYIKLRGEDNSEFVFEDDHITMPWRAAWVSPLWLQIFANYWRKNIYVLGEDDGFFDVQKGIPHCEKDPERQERIFLLYHGGCIWPLREPPRMEPQLWHWDLPEQLPTRSASARRARFVDSTSASLH